MIFITKINNKTDLYIYLLTKIAFVLTNIMKCLGKEKDL